MNDEYEYEKGIKIIQEYWTDKLVKYERSYLDQFELTKETKDYLEEVGLIRGYRYDTHLYIDFLEKFEEENVDGIEYIKIGKDTGIGLYLKKGTNEVYHFTFFSEASKEYRKYGYTNKSVYEYVLFETLTSKISEKYRPVYTDEDEIEGYKCGREIIEEFKKIDKTALYPCSCWSNRMLRYVEGYFYEEDEKFQKAISRGKYSNDDKGYGDALYDALYNGIEILEK